MKKLLLFAGLPGVGKSTISGIISKKIGAKIVDIDNLKKTDVDPTLVKNQIDPPEVRWVYYQKALKCAFDLFDRGMSVVIIDEVFHLNSLRIQLESLCSEKCQVLWVEVMCPYNIVEKRLHFTAREGHILSTKEALKMHILFKEVFESFYNQNHIVVNNENNVNMDLLAESILKA
ncbi:MAG: AAA family ATPase [Patescibacteria group bacterium]